MATKVEAFGWQAARKKLRPAPEVREELGTAFRREEDLEEEIIEEAPVSATGQLEDSKTKCKRLVAEGGILAQSERFAEALGLWEQALTFAEDPGDKAKILEQMAQVLLELDRVFDAVRTAQRAVETRPMWHWCHVTLGRALLCFGELERAVESLRRASHLVTQERLSTESTKESADEEGIRLELEDAERLWAEAQSRSRADTSREVIVNGRVVESRFWETALRVTYDEQGRPTTHFPEDMSEMS
eukprot:TRINITY_DN708_c1_g5_i1.p1 TRINITY_DN708_c1_g5~~TRINITY_DN708_c1_g5_i1.p1  ORF type:complete len:245 (-),score=57.02 TRINITY_DN708_c1_g5_i1:106-840(-)